jgi:hypothetical protein
LRRNIDTLATRETFCGQDHILAACIEHPEQPKSLLHFRPADVDFIFPVQLDDDL